MGLFGKKVEKGPKGNVLPNWSIDAVSRQHHLAQSSPDLLDLARQVVANAGRGSLLTALTRLYTMIGFQSDQYASQSADLKRYDFATIREQLMSRPDFDDSMLFSSLTYFGPAGIAANNSLIEQLPVFVEVLEEAAREGHLDS